MCEEPLHDVDAVVRQMTDHRRPIVVQGAPGSGALLIAESAVAIVGSPLGAARTHGAPATDVQSTRIAVLDACTDDELVALRSIASTVHLLLVTEAPTRRPAVRRLLDYIRPVIVDIGPLTLDETRAVIEHEWGALCSDEFASSVCRSAGGRLGDIVDIARHLPPGSMTCSLAGFGPTAERVGAHDPGDDLAEWAIAVSDDVAILAPSGPSAPWRDVARPVDAAVIAQNLRADHRRAVLRRLCERAASIPADTMPASGRVTVGRWWCEVVTTSDPLGHQELLALLAGVQDAFTLNRWSDALAMTSRLWTTTGVPAAAVGLAAALTRHDPDDRLASLEHHADPLVRVMAAFTRASWQFFGDHDPDAAATTLETALSTCPGDVTLLVDGLAMIDLHSGRLDAADARLAARPPSTEPATPFALSVSIMAMLLRGAHRRAIDELDDGIAQWESPGINLTAERYRFFRAMALSQFGDGGSALPLELAEIYERSLGVGDDWGLGWAAWAAGVDASRRGRLVTAMRRCRTASDAFRRARRPGFAMWPDAAFVQAQALVGEPSNLDSLLNPGHAVLADRADALLAVAMARQAAGAPRRGVAAQLQEAAAMARDHHEVISSYRIGHEQLLLGFDPDEPIADGRADGVLVETWADVCSANPDDVAKAASTLASRGWTVLGARHFAWLAHRRRASDPRNATHFAQQARRLFEQFDRPIAAWAMPALELPTLSARELQVAELVAAGASRDDVAAQLVVSRRTVDSHLQRIYAKLGASGRADLREWLDGGR